MKNGWRTILRSGLLGLLALPLVPFAAVQATAESQTGAIDTARLDAFVGEQVQRHGIPGVSLGIVEGDRIVHLRGFGKADQTGCPMTPRTPFVIASMSKPLTATAVMQLVEAGEVELDAPVRRYVPDFRMADPVASGGITVRHLLQHTSGIPVTSCDTREGAETLAQYVAELRTVELDGAPGAEHSYCSGNYNVLGRIIETVSGQPFGDYMERNVFTPLQMRRSYTSEGEAERAGMGQNYRFIFGVAVPHHERYNTSQLPSGFLISTAEDMTHFLIAHLNGGRYDGRSVLSAEGIAAMQAPGVPTGSGDETYGLGWERSPLGGVPVIQHAGTHADFYGVAFIEPRTQRGAVLMFNAFGTLAAATAYKEVEAGVARLVVGREPAPASSLTLGRLYLIVDAVLGALLALALVPLLRMRRWAERLRRRHQAGRPPLLRVGLRLLWELGLPLLLLIGVRMFIGVNLGAQSWAEILMAFPDFTVWLWAVSLVILLTGALRLAISLRTFGWGEWRHFRAGVSQPSSS
jgi:CubicO group peptidase (beta-lactamase class C family)